MGAHSCHDHRMRECGWGGVSTLSNWKKTKNKVSPAVNYHFVDDTTGDESEGEGVYSAYGRERSRGRCHSGALMPDCELDPDACTGCAWHNGVWPSPRDEEHEKENQRLFPASFARGKGG